MEASRDVGSSTNPEHASEGIPSMAPVVTYTLLMQSEPVLEEILGHIAAILVFHWLL